MKWLQRMFTLPKRFNSFGDIARNPVGAVFNTAQWALPLVAGLPGGFRSVGQLIRNPSLISKWSLGNIAGIAQGTNWKGIGNWLKKPENLALVAGGLQFLEQSRRAQNAERRLNEQVNSLFPFAEQERALASAINAMRQAWLQRLVQADSGARAIVEQEADNLRRALGRAGLAGSRSASEALGAFQANLAGQRMRLPLQQAQVAFGLPVNLGTNQLALSLLGQQYAQQLASAQGILDAILQLSLLQEQLKALQQQRTI